MYAEYRPFIEIHARTSAKKAGITAHITAFMLTKVLRHKKGPSSNMCSACECWDKDTFSPNLIFWQRNAVFSLLLVERWWYFPRQLSDRILFHRNEIENVSHISNSIVSIVFRGRKFHISKKVDVRWSFLWRFDHHEKCFVKAIIHVSVRLTNQTHVSGYMIVWWSIKQNKTQCHVKITE